MDNAAFNEAIKENIGIFTILVNSVKQQQAGEDLFNIVQDCRNALIGYLDNKMWDANDLNDTYSQAISQVKDILSTVPNTNSTVRDDRLYQKNIKTLKNVYPDGGVKLEKEIKKNDQHIQQNLGRQATSAISPTDLPAIATSAKAVTNNIG